MAAAAISPTAHLSDAELRRDGREVIAELWKAVDAAVAGSPEVRAAVSAVLVSLLDEAGVGSPYASTLRAVIDALVANTPRAAGQCAPPPVRRGEVISRERSRRRSWRRTSPLLETGEVVCEPVR